MGKFNGTPGKWVIPEHRDNIVNDEKGFHIATVWIAGIGNDNQLYNTKLIAAAPELLEKLQYMVDAWEDVRISGRKDIMETFTEYAKEVIKKATE